MFPSQKRKKPYPKKNMGLYHHYLTLMDVGLVNMHSSVQCNIVFPAENGLFFKSFLKVSLNYKPLPILGSKPGGLMLLSD